MLHSLIHSVKNLLTHFIKDAVLHRYPSRLHENMLQRAYTYVPGEEAYGDAPSQVSSELNAAVTGTPQVTDETNKKFKPIILKK